MLLLQSKILAGLLATSEVYTCLFFVSRVLESKYRALLTSDLLPNISLAVEQSSGNTSLALRARKISTSRLSLTSDILGKKSFLARIYFLKKSYVYSLGIRHTGYPETTDATENSKRYKKQVIE